MLRITTHETPESLTFQLEGKLAGPWVEELEKCWLKCGTGDGVKSTSFDLSGLMSIDAAGKEFLAARYGEGARLIAAGCLMKSVVAEVCKSQARPHS
jgi:hypothetical protein